jgi:hypothetical protein
MGSFQNEIYSGKGPGDRFDSPSVDRARPLWLKSSHSIMILTLLFLLGVTLRQAAVYSQDLDIETISLPDPTETAPPVPETTGTPEERAKQILDKNPLIGPGFHSVPLANGIANLPLDVHNDLLIQLRGAYRNRIYGAPFRDRFDNGSLEGHVDLLRMEKGQLGGAFWSAYIPCPANGWDFSDENYASCKPTLLFEFHDLHRM